MKIIITEHQYKILFESPDNSDLIKQILDLDGLRFDGCQSGARIYENGVPIVYSVSFIFSYVNKSMKIVKNIWYNVNNNVVSFDSMGAFDSVANGFKYIPPKVLNSYFIKIGKEFLEKRLSIKSPNDNKLNESVGNSNVVEQIMDMDGVEYAGCGYGGRSYDNFKRKHDTVDVYFKLLDEQKLYSIRIHFLTKNNKVVSVDSTGDFRTITDGFRYIPTDLLIGYFIEKAKTYIEKLLPKLYPNDSLKESVIKEDNLKSELKQMIKSDGWEETYPLVGDAETLAQFAFDNDPMKFIDLLITKKRKGKHSDFFGDDDDRLFLQFTPGMEVVELNFELSEFLLLGFKLDRNGAKNVIKDWLFDRYGIEINDVSKIYL